MALKLAQIRHRWKNEGLGLRSKYRWRALVDTFLTNKKLRAAINNSLGDVQLPQLGMVFLHYQPPTTGVGMSY